MSKVGHGVQACVSWLPCYNGQIPPNAIPVGGGTYICRAMHEGQVVPGKLHVDHNTGYIPYGGEEKAVHNCEVLVDTGIHRFGNEIEWIPSSYGQSPKRALIGGATAEGEPLYVARTMINDEWVAGKVCKSHNCAYFPWGGEEHSRENYEVLCCTKH